MGFWKAILDFCEARMEEPTSFGWYHFMWVGIIAAFTVFMCIKFKNCSEKTLRRISLIVFIVLVVLDLYKQITYDWVDFDETTGSFVWDYAWYSFPFQLCSTPHYVLPFIIFLPDGKLRDAFLAFMMFFSFVGGLCVFVYPEDCFTPFIGVNIQTMTHHGMQIVLAVLYAVHERRKIVGEKYGRYFIRAIPVFVVFMLIAFGLNIGVNAIFESLGMDDTFNMFYIGPVHPCSLPVLSAIYPLVPYPVFFCLYLFGFILAGFILYNVFYWSLRPSVLKERLDK